MLKQFKQEVAEEQAKGNIYELGRLIQISENMMTLVREQEESDKEYLNQVRNIFN